MNETIEARKLSRKRRIQVTIFGGGRLFERVVFVGFVYIYIYI